MEGERSVGRALKFYRIHGTSRRCSALDYFEDFEEAAKLEEPQNNKDLQDAREVQDLPTS